MIYIFIKNYFSIGVTIAFTPFISLISILVPSGIAISSKPIADHTSPLTLICPSRLNRINIFCYNSCFTNGRIYIGFDFIFVFYKFLYQWFGSKN